MPEPLVTTPRMKITPTESPAPPWAGLQFDCERCEAVFVLEAADECDQIEGCTDAVLTPACRDCGHRSVVMLRVAKGNAS